MGLTGNQQTDSPMKRALRAIDDLEAKLAAMERAKTEQDKLDCPVAVIGMGCRFPGGADNPALFWKLLKNGEDAITDLPVDRWNLDEYYDPDPDAPGKMYIRHGGFLDRIDLFDAQFFGISPREAMCMDPQHRLVLEVGWEAIEYAGINPESLNGSRTGVFVGIGQNDYARLKLSGADATQIDIYDGTGNLLCFAPGRLAYVLGLRGPNMAIDTACSSSLVAIHQACQSLRVGDCDLALAGGVHLVISPEVTIFLSRAHVLAPDGRCKTFDAAADGFARGEGCGMIVLKRLSDAIKDRDTILALIRGSAINHDGASSGLTVPNELAQEELIIQATKNARVEPGRVTYVEAHGTGTSLGDPIEVNALAAALCKGRTSENLLVIGSVKTNIGHLEAAAGISGVIKVILSLQHKEIPPHLHFKIPNPHIDWKEMSIEVAAEGRSWMPPEGRIAGVSSFGFSGTNAHIVLEEASEYRSGILPEKVSGSGLPGSGKLRDTERALHILALSAKSDAALHSLVERYEKHLAEHPEQEIGDLCFTANTGRSLFAKRMSVIAATKDELKERLTAYRQGRACTGLYTQDSPDDFGKEMMNEAPANLAKEFVKGGAIAWGDYYKGNICLKLALPTYPFQRQRYWIDNRVKVPARCQRCDDEEILPAWGRRLHLPFSREVRFENSLSENSPAHLADHRLLGAIVVSAASQISMVLASAGEAFGPDARRIGEMVFLHPLIIPVKGHKAVQLIFLPGEKEEITFRLVSGELCRGETDSSRITDWITYSSGKVFVESASCRHTTESTVRQDAGSTCFDPDVFCSRSDRILMGDEFYTARRQSGYQFGPSFRWAEKICQSENETLCAMTICSPGEDGDQYPLHPGLLDSCFQMIGGFWEADQDSDHLLVPVRIGNLRFYRQHPSGKLWCVARREAHDGAVSQTRKGSLQLLDEKGDVFVEVDGFEFGRAKRELFTGLTTIISPPKESLYNILWRPAPLPGSPLGPPHPSAAWLPASRMSEPRIRPIARNDETLETTGESLKANWLLFADRSGVASKLAEQLRTRGDEVILVTQEKPFAAHATHGARPNRYCINPETPADISRLFLEIGTQLKGVIYLWGIDLGQTVNDEAISQAEIVCGAVPAAVRAMTERQSPAPMLWLVTQGAFGGLGVLDKVAPLQSMLWGLGSVLDLEHPELCVRSIDIDPLESETTILMLLEEILHPDAENRIALRRGVRHTARLEMLPEKQADVIHFDADACYLITGGLGGLGLEIARWMERNGACNLILCGRSDPTGLATEKIERIRQVGCNVLVFTADVSDREDVKRLINGIESSMPPLRGVIHAAGIIDDAVFIRQDTDRFRKVMASKVRGTLNIHEATMGEPLDFFVCFSSAAAIIGAGGQANYAAANAFMDAFVHERRRQGLPGMSVNWGAWGEVGMAARMSVEPASRRQFHNEVRGGSAVQGMGAIAPEKGLEILGNLLRRDAAQAVVMAVDWDHYLENHYRKEIPPFFETLARGQVARKNISGFARLLNETPADQRRTRLFDYVRSQVSATLGMTSPEQLDPSQRLFDVGIDSLMAVELKNRLESGLGPILFGSLRSTLVFDYPTVEALVKHLSEDSISSLFPQERTEALFAAQQIETNTELMRAEQVKQAEPVAIIGMACRFPGGADDPDTFWRLLKSGADAITEVPRDRWDIDAFYDPDPTVPGKMCCRYGGFLERADLFDAEFFGISPREAVGMDPQQRLLLEVSWEALEHANQMMEQLFGSATGVFVGISTFDYALIRAGLLDRNSIDAYQVSGANHSVAAGRLSYLLGLAGPCMSIDTACSSSLVGIHLACQSLRNREISMALAAGVGYILAPEPSINFSKAGMLARDGRCKTFDSSADGYVRGEGCGVIVLKRLADALGDGDRVLAIIRGSAVNQDGASGGLTVPSGPSQEEVIRQAVAGCGLEPRHISYVEAHGTGTSLGDPIEINAMAAALCKERTYDDPLIVGSVKTNIGHLEAAAGIAGVIKVVLSLQHKEIPAQLHFRTPNPHIDWKNIPIKVATKGMPWVPAAGRRIAGVSAFGFSGTNAHVVLEEVQNEISDKDGDGWPLHLLTLSAKTEEALNRLADRYQLHISAHPEQQFKLGDLCYTANTSRSHFGYRLAIIAATKEELKAGLNILLAAFKTRNMAKISLASAMAPDRCEPASCRIWLTNEPVNLREKQIVRFDLKGDTNDFQNDLQRLAKAYVNGVRIDWDHFYAEQAYNKVTLPTYPFLQERFWLETAAPLCGAGILPARTGFVFDLPHPLLGRRLRLPLSREIRFETTFSKNSQAFLDDHQLFGTIVVAGATWLSMVLQSVQKAFHRETIILEGVLLEKAMTIGDGDASLVQTLIIPESEGLFTFQIISRGGQNIFWQTLPNALQTRSDEDNDEQAWDRHVFGKIRIPKEMSIASLADAYSWSEVAQATWESIDASAFYAEISMAGHILGDSFRWIRNIWKQGKESFCLLEAPETSGGYEDFLIYPGLIDSCFQFFCIWGQRLWEAGPGKKEKFSPEDQSATYIPFSMDEIQFFGQKTVPSIQWPKPGSRLWCHSEIDTIDPLTQGMTGNITLFDESGEILLKISGLNARKLTHDRLLNQKTLRRKTSREEWLYRVDWLPIYHPSSGDAGAGGWLIFSDSRGVGEAIGKLLQQQGENVILIFPGPKYSLNKEGHYLINPDAPSDFIRLIGECCDVGHPCKGIIHFWSLDTGDGMSHISLEKAETLACGSILYLVQALSRNNAEAQPRLWLVTSGAQSTACSNCPPPVTSIEPGLCPHQSLIWGLGNVIRMEHPEWKCSCIDIDISLSLTDDRLQPSAFSYQTTLLFESILRADMEDRIMIRDHSRYGARIMPLLLPYKGKLTLLPDATYLITGGLGVLGLETARWLAEKGAANLVLLGRNEGSAAAEEQVSKLRQSGVSVKVLKADVTKRADVLMIIEAISGMPPLKGIIHGAGVLSDGVLMKQDMERFHRVISPKADGAWNLHEATLGLNLDFFVCFSSVASVLGSAGQSNYAAANAFLNGFMYERRRQGLHGLSVNWGPWELGMAAGLDNRDAERIAARGIGAISPAEGFDVLEQLILHDETDACVLPVSWDKYLRYHYQGTIPPFFQAVTEESSGNRSASEEKSAIIGKLEGTPAGQRSTVLIDYVQKQVAMVLHLKQTKRVSPDQGLFDLGIDSLMAMELKNKFEADMGRPLRPTLIFDYPTVDALASYLAEEMGMADDQSHQTTQEYRKNKGSGAVVVLSAEEINDSIADELAKLESLLKG